MADMVDDLVFFISYSRYHSRKISVQCIKNPKERLIKIKVAVAIMKREAINIIYVRVL